jgi:hypothetical protein
MQAELLRAHAGEYDAATLVPLLGFLPRETQEKLIGEGVEGYEGRTALVQATVKEIRKLAAAEAEDKARAKLRKDPAFRKELLAELRGAEDEPELAAAGSAAGRPLDMNDRLRAMAGFGRR